MNSAQISVRLFLLASPVACAAGSLASDNTGVDVVADASTGSAASGTASSSSSVTIPLTDAQAAASSASAVLSSMNRGGGYSAGSSASSSSASEVQSSGVSNGQSSNTEGAGVSHTSGPGFSGSHSGSHSHGSGSGASTSGGGETTSSFSSGGGGTSTSSASGTGSSATSGSGDSTSSSTSTTSGTGSSGASGSAVPSGWLYTSGNQIYLSNGSGTGTVWMGRGVNIDDIFFCGYNDSLWMTSPGTAAEAIVSNLITGWNPSFVRVSLSMNSYQLVSWLTNPAQYATPMTNVIDALGTHPGVYVLVTLRSDGSMIGEDTTDGDAEATGIPSDSTTTPNAALYPTGTDAVYEALVTSFASSSFVVFGLTNEPGGDKATNATLSAAMSHAVGVIRAKEDSLGVPHHLVSVQGNDWTSSIGLYNTAPLPYDNVVYEYHGYPPLSASYTQSSIPVIIGEYGGTGTTAADIAFTTAFFADVESKHIPNLAWDVDPYSSCAPDLVAITTSTTLTPQSPWGTTVQSYLTSH